MKIKKVATSVGVFLGVLVSLVLFSANVQAGNPGKPAMNCLSASNVGGDYDNLVFENRCGYKIFVVWCGDLKYANKGCGEGSNYTYYTHSANIEAYGKKTTTIKAGGSYSYAACEGGIGFGSKGIEHSAGDGGSFRCTPTGSGY